MQKKEKAAAISEQEKVVSTATEEVLTSVEDEIVEMTEADEQAAKKAEAQVDEARLREQLEAEREENDARIFAEATKDNEKVFGQLSSMSKRKKNKRYKSYKGYITREDELDMDTPQHRASRTFQEVAASFRGKTILKGKVSAMVESDNMKPFAKVFYNDYEILIPFEELIPSYMVTMTAQASNAAKQRWYGHLIQQRLGSVVDFVVTGINEESKQAAASRLEAMRMIRSAYFWRKRSGKYIVDEGDVVQARVVYVTSGGVGVEIFGCELFIKAEDCSFNRINVEDYFRTGDNVWVKLNRIVRKTANGKNSLGIEASIRDAYPNPKEINFGRFDEGGIYMAKVTHVDEYGIFVMLADCLEAKCYFQRGEVSVPEVGDELQVQITSKNPETLMVNAQILRRLPPRKSIF